MATFYPRWFSSVQAGLAGIAGGNQPAGPHRMIPFSGCVVAPTGDTLYAAGFFDLSREPVSLTIPPIDISYSVLAVDAYRAAFSNLNVHDAGTYALIGPGWPEDLQPGITPIHVPGVFSVWIFRVGRFFNGTGQTAAAGPACQHRIIRRTAQRRGERPRPVARRLGLAAARASRREPGGLE